MIQQRPEQPNPASGFLVFMLVALLALALFIVLNILSMGAFTWVIAITLVIATVGSLHYLLWGHDLTQQVADERETFLRQQAREREQEEGWRG